MARHGPPDFSSLSYWSDRFEGETSFEWLARSEVILPLVQASVDAIYASSLVPALTSSSSSSALHSPASPASVSSSGSTPPPESLPYEGAPDSGTITQAEEDAEARASTRSGAGTEEEIAGRGASFRILHFGCGSSLLGADIQSRVTPPSSLPLKVVDTDYVLPSLLSSRPIPVFQVDMLDQDSLGGMTAQSGGEWDLVIDKSTADAISCGSSIWKPLGGTINGFSNVPPLTVLCENLAWVVKKGGRWLCVSYSSTRFDDLKQLAARDYDPRFNPLDLAAREMEDDDDSLELEGLLGTPWSPGWKMISKQPLSVASMPEGRVIKDGKGFRTVYQPETPIWLYILERI